MKKQALGRGLSALIETEPVAAVGSTLFNEIEISKINPNPNQPRTEFDDMDIRSLAESIGQNGILQPLSVRKSGEQYEIVSLLTFITVLIFSLFVFVTYKKKIASLESKSSTKEKKYMILSIVSISLVVSILIGVSISTVLSGKSRRDS